MQSLKGAVKRAGTVVGAAGRNSSQWMKNRMSAKGANLLSPEQAYALSSKYKTYLSSRPANIFLVFTNILYLGVTLAILILGLLIVKEHAHDFTRNSFESFRGPDGSVTEPRPCGMGTPDGMKLLEGLGSVGGGGWQSVSLEPDYQNWMKNIDRSLCSKLVPQYDVNQISNYNEGYLSNTGAKVNDAHYLMAVSYLMDDASLRPIVDEVVAGDLSDKVEAFETRACLTDKEDTLEPFYPAQQLDSYGDYRVRIARAYIAAMPAFVRYHVEKADCAIPDGTSSPFDEFCTHASFIDTEMQAAAQDGAIMLEAAGVIKSSDPTNAVTGGVSLLAMVYRLLALSLAGYHDRVNNGGRCFKNDAKKTAIDFCHDALVGIPQAFTAPAEGNHASELALVHYNDQHDLMTEVSTCRHTVSPPPPSPAPLVFRMADADLKVGISASNPGGDDTSPWERVCAATLRYGLVEQGRLFGLPDITDEFVVDNRADQSLHFTAKLIYEGLYLNPWKSSDDVLGDPKARLEAYMAYRLASTTIWGMLTATVVGFFFLRSSVPLVVFALRFINVQGTDGNDIVLARPKPDYPTFVAVALAFLMFYWLAFIDPATQSAYYTTTDCGDWHGLGVMSASAPYVTTWGKRRFDRLGEYVIGILLLVVVGIFVFQQLIGKRFLSAAAKTAVKKGTPTARQLAYVVVPIIIGCGIEACFAIQAGLTGKKWLDASKGNDQTSEIADVLVKDCYMAVWAAFWTGGAIGCLRQKWAVNNLPRIWKLAWFGSTTFLFLMPFIQSNIYLSDEIAIAFKNGRGTADRTRNELWYATLALTCLYAAPLFLVWKKIASTFVANPAANTAANIRRRKEDVQQAIRMATSGDNQLARDLRNMVNNTGMPSACFTISTTAFKADQDREMAPSSAEASMHYGAATGVTGGNKINYLPLLPMV